MDSAGSLLLRLPLCWEKPPPLPLAALGIRRSPDTPSSMQLSHPPLCWPYGLLIVSLLPASGILPVSYSSWKARMIFCILRGAFSFLGAGLMYT